MCGIVGILSQDLPVSRSALARATQALRHRGPDDENVWVSSTGRVGLGHTRLSVVDLASGAHPISSEDGTVHIVVNGEFYGDAAIRRDLEQRGHIFRTRSDSEIALHLYEESGRGCLRHLRGEFAFIIWDERQGSLFAARDRFGIKPLFFAEVDGTLYLASEAKALFAAGVPARWDEDTVFQYLFFCLDQRRSLFEGIAQVPPGHYLIATDRSTRLARYWDISYPRAGRQPQAAREDVVDRTRHLLEEAVRLRLRGDVPAGFLVSGGLDSSSVLGLAAPHAGHPLMVFTVAFDGKPFDESAPAELMARHVGAQFRQIHISEREIAEHFVETVLWGETIQLNGHAVARFLLSRFIQRSGYKVVLSGEGADELFEGYGFCQTVAAGAPGSRGRALLRFLRSLAPPDPSEAVISETSPWLFRLSHLLGVPPAARRRLGEGLTMIRSVIGPDVLLRFRRRDPYRELLLGLEPTRRVLGREPAKKLLYLWTRSLFANYHLAADRLDMANGVEVRLPFLDHVLFDFVSQLPTHVLAMGGRAKGLLREAARTSTPPSIYGRDKHGFLAPPLTSGDNGKVLALIQDVVRTPSFASVPFLDRPGVLALLDRMSRLDPVQQMVADPLILMVGSIAILHDHYRL